MANNGGENNALARLSLEQVERIRELYSEGLYSYADLGRTFKVSRHTISSLLSGRSWQGQGALTTKEEERLRQVRMDRSNTRKGLRRWQ